MRIDDPNLLNLGDKVRCRGNGPIYVVKAVPVRDDPLQRVGIWHKIAGWRAQPFSRLTLVQRSSAAAREHSSPRRVVQPIRETK